jgi:predicted O-linked N-acetylglucosamine transferase (SPINDLY family)
MFERELHEAVTHHAAGRLDAAEAIYRQILARQPKHAPTLHLLGVLSHQRGDNETATQLVEQALRIGPPVADYYANLGLILHARGRMEESATALTEAVRMNPHHADAWNNLGSALRGLGRGVEALDAFRRAIVMRPTFRLAALNLAATLWDLGRLDEAVAAQRSTIALDPSDAAPHFRLGLFLQQLRRPQEAVAAYQRAIELDPNAFESHANLGNALRDMGQVEPAIAHYREAVRLRPDLGACRVNLAAGLLSIGDVEEAETEAEAAIRLQPDLDEAYTTRLLAMQYRTHSHKVVLDAHRQWARARADQIPTLATQALPQNITDRPLRVGLVSADFYDHPVAYFLEPLLAAHDRSRLEVTCYSSVRVADALTQRLQANADHWRDVSLLPHERVAAQIVDDRIDVLIDLAGHTAGSRLPVFAMKPAPVQVSYLGYPATTGLSKIDFRLTDNIADPPGATELQYTETLVRLPKTLACYAPPTTSPPVGGLPALRPDCNGQITFASFSSLTKIAPETIDLWARALRAVPNSRMVVMGRGAGGAGFADRLRAQFSRFGVGPERIDLRPSGTLDEYLKFHHEVDVILDTFPFNGHTTLCHALWMGVPAISLSGDRFASRLGRSVLVNAGLPEFAVDSAEAFVEVVQNVCGDLAGLRSLRQELRDRLTASPLFDRLAFSRDFAHALHEMARLAG